MVCRRDCIWTKYIRNDNSEEKMKIMIQLYIVQYSEDYDLVFTMSMQRDFKIDSQSLYADIIYASIFFIFDAQLLKCS